MQRRLDTYFKPNAAKPAADEANAAKPKKRKAIIYSSDEEDVNQKNVKSNNDKKSRIESDAKLNVSRLKPIDPFEVFGSEIMRVERSPRKTKNSATVEKLSKTEIIVCSDEEDVKSNGGKKARSDNDAKLNLNRLKPIDPSEVFGSGAMRVERSPRKTKNSATVEKLSKTEIIVCSDEEDVKSNGGRKARPDNDAKLNVNRLKAIDASEASGKGKSPKKKSSPNDKLNRSETIVPTETKANASLSEKAATQLDMSLDASENGGEKLSRAALFYKMQNRPSVLNPGCKELPEGAPGCLNGLSFLVTGVLESLEREECNNYIKDLGGKLFKSVGKTLNYLVVGEEPGPKKIEDAKKYGIKMIDEDALLELVKEKSKSTNGNAQKKQHTTVSKPNITKSPKTKHVAVSPVKAAEKLNLEIKSEQSVAENSKEILALVEKYKPNSIKEIIGQQGAASNVQKLRTWLSEWFSVHNGKTKPKAASAWGKNDGKQFKAVLLSGPPGVGKTTTANLVCKELQFDVVEMNASDTRNKRLLKEEVSELLSNKSLFSYIHGDAKVVSKRHVLIMDEVDGMAGNEDRGGLQELIGFIKESSVPIICICNDRSHPKMRSLVNYCYDLRFNKPRMEQIKGRILSICCREKIKIEPAKIEQIIAATNNDIRQSINHIAFLNANKELNLPLKSNEEPKLKMRYKDVKLGPWDIIRKLFTASENKNMSFAEKNELFFHDYSLMPLFVQQNYLQACPSDRSATLTNMALAADALSLGDQVDKCIRSQSAWSMLPTLSILSFVLPGDAMCGFVKGQINFPSWLGKNSRANKCNRLAQDIYDHTRIKTSGSRLSIRLDYAGHMLSKLCYPLKMHGNDGVNDALDVLKEYQLLREDIESLIELTTWNGQKSIWDSIDSKVKSALTRAYNKNCLAYSYSAVGATKGKKAKIIDPFKEESSEGEDEAEAEAEDDNIEDNVLIKKKKITAITAKKSKK